jgi:fructose-1,6-bisphosphatase/sedoheptulose 1,7-bisphosphatase-like protein
MIFATTSQWITYSQIAAPLVFTIVGIAGFGWFKILKGTNELLKEQNAELKEVNRELLFEKEQRTKEMGIMHGQIDVLKSIPLVNIDSTLQRLAETNGQILKTLQHSATQLTTDTASAASAVKKVKRDLEHTK